MKRTISLPALILTLYATNVFALQALVLDVPDTTIAESLAGAVANSGYEVDTIEYLDLVSRDKLTNTDLLVLPKASALPVDSVAPIQAFLEHGGDLIALDAPLWRTPLVQDGDAWIDRNAYRENHKHNLMEAPLFAFRSDADLDGWQRSTSNPAFGASHTIVADPNALNGSALHVTVDDIDSWDTFMSPMLENPFPAGHTLTVFFAKGDANTPSLSVEWTERDTSRWIATVPLSTDWRCFVLQPSDFKFWDSVPGRKDSTFNPNEANQLRVGLAFSHTPMSAGNHQYWLGTVGTAPRSPEAEPLLTQFTSPRLETLCPNYKFFECGDVAQLLLTRESSVSIPLPQGTIRSPHPRPTGAGYDKGRVWRFEPLLEARTNGGEWRGTPATLFVHADGPFKGGVWASFGIEDLAWYTSPEALALIGDVAKRMHSGLFLIDAGTAYYTHFSDQPLTAGARIANLSQSKQHVRLRTILTDSDTIVARDASRLDLAPMSTETCTFSWPSLAPNHSSATVRTELRSRGKTIDRTSHDLFVWIPKASPRYVTVDNGEFMLDGQRWRAHGVNYMPSSGIGRDDWYDFEHWIGASAYDPTIIQRDLDHIAAMGLNSVSIFIYHESLEAQNLLDLLRRLDAMGLKANLSLRPGTPLDFEWEKIRELLTLYRIAEHDCVFALDLAWEPMFPDHEGRTRYDAQWRAWIEERYGSIESAEADWQFETPRNENGAATNPTDTMVTEDGPWRIMVAAYRRFLDTLLYANYSKARDLVREVDPHHLVSFRMTEAGDPTFRGTSVLPYDYPYLAAAVDILEPEAYGRIGDWDRVKPALFQAAYGRWAAPHLPFLWAEAGVHVWDPVADGPLPERLDFQAEYYGHIYRMLFESGADGIFWWWYPGGYRVNERSDYGIVNPDGSDRPVTRVIRNTAGEYLNGPPEPNPDVWLTFDRDAHPAGVPGVYEHLKDEYWQLRDAGQTPGLKTAGTGTTSADTPCLAIGGVPCNGANPPKYLDAFFDRVRVRIGAGDWRDVADGETLNVPPDTQVSVQCTVTNLGEATWFAGTQDGAVVLRVEPLGIDVPLTHDVPRFASVVLDTSLNVAFADLNSHVFALRLNAIGRSPFGPILNLTCLPSVT